jgi:hypothetical protein
MDKGAVEGQQHEPPVARRCLPVRGRSVGDIKATSSPEDPALPTLTANEEKAYVAFDECKRMTGASTAQLVSTYGGRLSFCGYANELPRMRVCLEGKGYRFGDDAR